MKKDKRFKYRLMCCLLLLTVKHSDICHFNETLLFGRSAHLRDPDSDFTLVCSLQVTAEHEPRMKQQTFPQTLHCWHSLPLFVPRYRHMAAKRARTEYNETNPAESWHFTRRTRYFMHFCNIQPDWRVYCGPSEIHLIHALAKAGFFNDAQKNYQNISFFLNWIRFSTVRSGGSGTYRL